MKQHFNRRQLLQAGAVGSLGFALNQIFPSMANASNIWQGFTAEEVIRISSNENPYGPSKLVQKAIMEAITKSNRYGFAAEGDLIKLIADREKVSPDCVMIGAGSTELLYVMAAYYGRNKTVLMPEITFFGFMRQCTGLGVNMLKVPMGENMAVDLKAMEKKLSDEIGLVYLANPNNPTGEAIQKNPLKDFCEVAEKKTTVFVDEAYLEFADSAYYGSMIDLVKANKNVVIARTFSKIYGLAGLRIGYLIAKPEIIDKLYEVRVGIPNILGITAAMTAYKDQAFLDMVKQKNREVKTEFEKTLTQMKIPFVPGPTNFIFANVNEDGQAFAKKLEAQKVLIAAFKGVNWARFTIGTKEEMDKVASILRKMKS
jgi:histidinol-phosphate aminotransferase